jgi:hypothetical protein
MPKLSEDVCQFQRQRPSNILSIVWAENKRRQIHLGDILAWLNAIGGKGKTPRSQLHISSKSRLDPSGWAAACCVITTT